MLQLNNQTPFQAERAILVDLDGSEVWVVAVKATFELKDGGPVVADEQEPVCLADEYFGEPGQSSLKYENELVFKKPGTDIVVNGHAYAPNDAPVTKLDAAIRVGPVKKYIRVYGDRVWTNTIGRLFISNPVPFVKMPLVYERAFGGVDLSSDTPKEQGAEDRNPIGRGFGKSRAFLEGKPLPNLEDPNDEIRRWKDRPQPTGFGFICKHWMPRRDYAGTYDQKWIEERLPLYPLDFDYRFFLGAPPDMVATPHLRGGEPVELLNLTPNGYVHFELPCIGLSLRTRLGREWVHHGAKLSTIILEPDVPRVLLVWQSMLPCHRKKFELKVTEIIEKPIASWN